MDLEKNEKVKLVIGTSIFSLFFIIFGLSIAIFLPSDEPSVNLAKTNNPDTSIFEEISPEDYFSDSEIDEAVKKLIAKEDSGLILYREPQTKSAVEWFYSRITNDRDVAKAILENADTYNIPLALAFALAHTESNFKITAMHKNSNGSIDRGLFQLNNNSFPKLTEEDFYNPSVSAKYGLSHLRHCLNTAGNEITALAMYNAGTNKVRKNNTPQVTLNYIAQIENYKNMLEENFSSEVITFFTPTSANKLLAQYNARIR